MQLTPKGFIDAIESGTNPHDALIQWGREKQQITEKMQVVRRVAQSDTRPLKIEEMETAYLPVPVSPRNCSTEKLVAHVLTQPRLNEVYVEKSGRRRTIDLVREAIDELAVGLHCTPTRIMLSRLRYLAFGEFTPELRYYCYGVHVPFIIAPIGCEFDVRVYGTR
jgi:hypothetical protein